MTALDTPLSLKPQDQTGYATATPNTECRMPAADFRRPQAVGRPAAPAVADDTSLLEVDFVLDAPTDSWQPTPSIQILGERFNLEVDDELGIVISHPKWSLMGCGRSVAEAEKMLMDYAEDLAEAMVDDSPLEYTEEGNRLREFALGFLYLSAS